MSLRTRRNICIATLDPLKKVLVGCDNLCDAPLCVVPGFLG